MSSFLKVLLYLGSKSPLHTEKEGVAAALPYIHLREGVFDYNFADFEVELAAGLISVPNSCPSLWLEIGIISEFSAILCNYLSRADSFSTIALEKHCISFSIKVTLNICKLPYFLQVIFIGIAHLLLYNSLIG